MIIVDINQIMISNLMVQINGRNAVEMNEDFVRHMILNSLRGHNKKFRKEYGQMVIACDSSNVWRKQVFPNYKAGRKANRAKSEHDWEFIFDVLAKIKQEIKDFLPYKVIAVESAEADDIIATLCKRTNEKVLILSGDKDFIQLHNDRIKQYNPVLNKFVGKGEDPYKYIREHILKGDKSDGIPNILSNDDCLDQGIRQTPLRKNVLEKYLRISIESDDKYYRNYLRNQTLIDLSFIPDDVEQQILDEYKQTAPVLGNVLPYLQKHRLNQLLDQVGDFSL